MIKITKNEQYIFDSDDCQSSLARKARVGGSRCKGLIAVAQFAVMLLLALATLPNTDAAIASTLAHRGHLFPSVDGSLILDAPVLKSSAEIGFQRNSGEEMPHSRNRREGFGPWEANELWDEKGKSHIAEMAKVVYAEVMREEKKIEVLVEQVENYFEQAREAVEHPIAALMKSKVGVIILVSASLFLVILIIRLIGPVIRMTFDFICIISKLIERILSFLCFPLTYIIKTSACCMLCCAKTPCVRVRNWFIANKIAKEDKLRMKTGKDYELEEMIQVLKRTYSKIKTDEFGVYLDAGDNHRVYLESPTQTEDLMTLRMLPNPERERGMWTATVKETILTGSKLYKTEKVPDFQGQFDVDGVTIGHFSRIKYMGKDCLLTAFHVLDYNRSAIINLKKGLTTVRLDSVRTRILCASKTEELDFLIMELPSFVFSTLSLKIGTWTPRVQAREPISIFQFFEGKPCVSSASIRLSEVKPWHINYSASTLPGTSGAPILDSRNNIIGVHVEHDAMERCNVGVIPPVFRNSRKESPTNEDILQGMAPLVQYEEPEDDETEEQKEERYERENAEDYYRILFARDVEDLKLKGETLSWGEQMDYIEDHASAHVRIYDIQYTSSGGEGRHVNRTVKRGVIRKESPWTCSKCNCIHVDRAYNCTNCGFALIKLTKQKLAERVRASQEAATCLRRKVPEEIVQKIMTPVINHDYVGEIAMRVCEMLKRTPGIYPQLPVDTTLLMDKHDAQRLSTKTLAPSYTEFPVTVNGNHLVVGTMEHDPVEEFREGSICFKQVLTPIAKIKTVKKNKETSTADGLTRSAKRRMRKETSAVPLNSQTPVQTGGPITNGAKRPLSQTKVSELASHGAPSKEGKELKNQASGKTSARHIPATQNMPGPNVAPRLRRSVSVSK